jgi:FkbM family methyltransferase
MTGSADAVNRAEGDVDRLIYERFFAGRAPGVFVDVGAARPDFLSISDFYRKKGWRIVAIEPNPEFAELHRKLGHEIHPYACGTEDRDDVEFCVVDSHGNEYEGGKVSFESFSSLAIKDGYARAATAPLDVRKIRVKLRRLDTILEEAGVTRIDVLSIDVEGWELEVIAGLDVARYAPAVLVVENFLRDPGYGAHIESLGYRHWRSLFPNEVYVAPSLLGRDSLWKRLVARLRARSA